MRDAMASRGGSCARSGAYELGSRCSGGQLTLLVGGLLGVVVLGSLFAWLVARSDGPLVEALLTMWGVLFAVLGWNFVRFGLHDPATGAHDGGWLYSGALFWGLAACGLGPALWLRLRRLRSGGAPEPALLAGPRLVTASARRAPLPRRPAPMPRRPKRMARARRPR